VVSGNAISIGAPKARGSPAPGTRLPEILLTSLAALAAAGEVEKACRLAGQACVALRGADPVAARRFDVLLHRLTPALDW
jgi:hypothetical protein